MKKMLFACAIAIPATFALAKLPPVDDAAKAKAAEASAKAAWQGKVDSWQLCKVQDKIAAKFASKAPKPAPAASGPAVAASGTPAPGIAAAPTIASCIDPGPFAYTPPEQKPLEASGAHSPTGTAASPPSVNKPQAEMKPGGASAPAKPASAAKKA